MGSHVEVDVGAIPPDKQQHEAQRELEALLLVLAAFKVEGSRGTSGRCV
jgi:hypothetical protein